MPNCFKCPPHSTASSSFGHYDLLMTHKFLNHVVLGMRLCIITSFHESAPFFVELSGRITNTPQHFSTQGSRIQAKGSFLHPTIVSIGFLGLFKHIGWKARPPDPLSGMSSYGNVMIMQNNDTHLYRGEKPGKLGLNISKTTCRRG